MSLQTIPLVLSSINTTVYRNWIKGISDALTALGVSKTTDTGQVNLTPTTLALPTTAQGLAQSNFAFNAFEMRSLVSAGKPTLYIKIRYGVFYHQAGTGVNYYWPAVSMEVGTATDGAGGLISPAADGSRNFISSAGITLTGSLSSNSGRPSPNSQNCYISSDGANYLNMVLGSNAPSFEARAIASMGIERTNTAGAATFTYNGNGFVTWNTQADNTSDNTTTASGAVPPNSPNGYSAKAYALLDLNNQQLYSGSSIPGQTPSYVYKPNSSTDLNLYPITVGVGHGPLLCAMGVDQNGVIENTMFSANVYNATRNFIAVTRLALPVDPFNQTSAGVRID